MDREVIPIGGSSSEETHHGASNSESSSSERLADLRNVSGGTSHLRRRARPFAASLDREPALVTMILPPSASVGIRRSGGKDIRVSPRTRRSHNVGSPSTLPAVAGYEWVRDKVLKYRSFITFAVSVNALQGQLRLASLEESCKMVAQACGSDDFPFLRVASGCLSFFFIYRCLFDVVDLVLSLNSF